MAYPLTSTDPTGVASKGCVTRVASTHASFVDDRMMLRHVRQSSFVSFADEPRDGRPMSTERGSVDFGTVGVQPLVPCTAVGSAGSVLSADCVDPTLRPLRVSPYEHDNRWQCLASVSQGTEWEDDASDSSGAGRGCAAPFFGAAQLTVMVSGESLANLKVDVEKTIVPVRKVRPPDPVGGSLRPRSGARPSSGDERWSTLRMGGKKAGGKSTATVAAYTALFLRCLTAVSADGAQSSDLHVIGCYVGGIKMGRGALYTAMLGVHKLLLYETLQEAIDAAQIAEDSLKVCRVGACSRASESLPDMQEALSELNEGQQQGDTATVTSPPQFLPLTSRMCDEGLVSCGPPFKLGERWRPPLCQTQEADVVKRSECGGDMSVLDERAGGEECLLPLLPRHGRLWGGGGALCSPPSFVRPRVVGGTESGLVEVQRTGLTSPAFLAADGRGGCGCELQKESLLAVMKAKGTEELSPRSLLHCSAPACAEWQRLIAVIWASLLGVAHQMGDPGGTVSAEHTAVTAHGCVCHWAMVPMVSPFLILESAVSSMRDVKAGNALWDGIEDVIHASLEDDQRRKVWSRPPHGGSEFGAASVAVSSDDEGSGAVAITFRCGRHCAACMEPPETERSASTCAVAMDTVGDTIRASSSGSGAIRPKGVLSMVLLGVEFQGGCRSTAMLVRRVPYVISQLMVAEVCAWLDQEGEPSSCPFSADSAASAVSVQSPTATAAVPCSRCDVRLVTRCLAASELRFSVVRQTYSGRGVSHSGCPTMHGCRIAMRVEGAQAPWGARTVVEWMKGNLLARVWAGRVVDEATLRVISSVVKKVVVMCELQTALLLERLLVHLWMKGDSLVRMWGGQVVEEETLRVTPSVVTEVGASSMWDDDQACFDAEMIDEGVASNSIIGVGSSGWSWSCLLMVAVRKDQCGVLGSKLRIAVVYRRAHARAEEDDESPSQVTVVAMLAERSSATELSAGDLMAAEDCGDQIRQKDLDPMGSDGGSVLSSDGLEQWNAMPSVVACSRALCQWQTPRVLMRGRLIESVPWYAVDVLICSCDDDTRACRVGRELNPLPLNSGCADPDSCEFFPSQVHCVDHAFSADASAEQQLQYAVVVMLERSSSRHPVVCTVEVRCCVGLIGYRPCLVVGHLSVGMVLMSVACKDSSSAWEEVQGLMLAQRNHPAAVGTSFAVADAEGLIRRRMAIVLLVQCIACSAADGTWDSGPTWITPFVEDLVVRFEGRWPSSEVGGYPFVVLMVEAASVAVMMAVGDERMSVMTRLALCSGMTAARLTAAKRRIVLDGLECDDGVCHRLRAALSAAASDHDPLRECSCVWGRGKSSQLPASLGVCLEERAGLALPSVATVVGCSKDLLEAAYADDLAAVMLNNAHCTEYQRRLACRFIGPCAVAARGVGGEDVALDIPGDMKTLEVINFDRVERYDTSVGEWLGQVRHRRPLLSRDSVGDDADGEYELGAMRGEKEEWECPSASTVDGSDADGWRMKVKVIMVVLCIVVLWKDHTMDSMDDCTWERDSSLANVNESVIDCKRRLLAEENESPSVMLLCVGGAD